MNVDEKRRRLRVPAKHLVYRVIMEAEPEPFRVLLHVILK